MKHLVIFFFLMQFNYKKEKYNWSVKFFSIDFIVLFFARTFAVDLFTSMPLIFSTNTSIIYFLAGKISKKFFHLYFCISNAKLSYFLSDFKNRKAF